MSARYASLELVGAAEPAPVVVGAEPGGEHTMGVGAFVALLGGLGLVYVVTRPKARRKRAEWAAFNRVNPWGA